MSRTTFHILASCAAAALATAVAAGPAEAGTVQFQLGEQDFADGRTPIFSREIRDAGAGEAFPFDGTIFGNDVKLSLGAFDYLHTFDLGGARPVSATLTVGLIDADSTPESPLDTVALTLDGLAQPGDVLRGISAAGSKSSVEVLDIPIPVELLQDGALRVGFAAVRPGFGNSGNAIEADFSRLVIRTEPAAVVIPDPVPGPVPVPGPGPLPPPPPIVDPVPQPIPLPPMLVPAGLLLAGLAAAPKRRLRRWMRL